MYPLRAFLKSNPNRIPPRYSQYSSSFAPMGCYAKSQIETQQSSVNAYVASHLVSVFPCTYFSYSDLAFTSPTPKDHHCKLALLTPTLCIPDTAESKEALALTRSCRVLADVLERSIDRPTAGLVGSLVSAGFVSTGYPASVHSCARKKPWWELYHSCK